MKIFFDVLLYIACVAAIVVFIIAVRRFPSWVEGIDESKNVNGKRNYKENAFIFRIFKIFLMLLPCFIAALASLLLGSMPNEMEEVSVVIAVPCILLILGSCIGGIFLGRYFNKIGKQYDVFTKTDAVRAVYDRSKAIIGLGIFICFYFCLIIFFASLNFLYLLNLL